MRYLLPLAILLMPLGVKAQVSVSGNTRLQPAVQQIAEGLKAGFPVWNIVILNRSDWAMWHKVDAHEAICAFSIPNGRITFVDETCLATNDHDMIQILAHEAGHMACSCASHIEADRLASTFVLAATR